MDKFSEILDWIMIIFALVTGLVLIVIAIITLMELHLVYGIAALFSGCVFIGGSIALYREIRG